MWPKLLPVLQGKATPARLLRRDEPVSRVRQGDGSLQPARAHSGSSTLPKMQHRLGKVVRVQPHDLHLWNPLLLGMWRGAPRWRRRLLQSNDKTPREKEHCAFAHWEVPTCQDWAFPAVHVCQEKANIEQGDWAGGFEGTGEARQAKLPALAAGKFREDKGGEETGAGDEGGNWGVQHLLPIVPPCPACLAHNS